MTISDWALLALDPAPDGVTFNIIYTYDPAGNRTSMDDGTTFTSYTYTNANRLILANAGGAITTFTNDAAGNRTQQQSPADTIVYSWDAPGRMTVVEVAAGLVTLTHNADGQRTAKQSTDASVTGFLYDHKKLLAETDDVGGDVTNLYATTSDGEYGDLISEDGDTSFHQYDAQADTNALLDNTGAVQAQYRYYAFGQVSAVNIDGTGWTDMSQADWESLPLDFTSHMMAGGKKQYYLDMETGLYLLGCGTDGRYYGLGRFLSEDPIRQADGDTNLFLYVHNDPIDRLDPSGHDGIDPNKDKNAQPVTPPADKKAESDKQNQTGNSTPPKVTPLISAKLPGTEGIPGKPIDQSIDPAVKGAAAGDVRGGRTAASPNERKGIPGEPIDQSFDPAVKGAAAGDVHGGTTAASPNERKEPQNIQPLKDASGNPIQLASTDNSAMAGAVIENKQPPTNPTSTVPSSPTQNFSKPDLSNPLSRDLPTNRHVNDNTRVTPYKGTYKGVHGTFIDDYEQTGPGTEIHTGTRFWPDLGGTQFDNIDPSQIRQDPRPNSGGNPSISQAPAVSFGDKVVQAGAEFIQAGIDFFTGAANAPVALIGGAAKKLGADPDKIDKANWHAPQIQQNPLADPNYEQHIDVIQKIMLVAGVTWGGLEFAKTPGAAGGTAAKPGVAETPKIAPLGDGEGAAAKVPSKGVPADTPTLKPASTAESGDAANAGLQARFRAGAQGQVDSAFAKIEPKDIGTGTPTTPAARDLARSLGNATDDAGHAIGKNLGAPGGGTSGNIFPQAPSVNRGAFAQFEQQVARQVQAGDEVYVRVVPRYAPGATRPFEIAYQVRINGVTTTRVFPNP